jgi:predicted RND superfamily exporter protein
LKTCQKYWLLSRHLFFEKEFDGIMPLEITIDTKKKKGVMKLSTLRKMDELQETIEEIPELSNQSPFLI